MGLRTRIETDFHGNAFIRPLFYAVSPGLRFQLAEGGTFLAQFLLALRKATEICADVFNDEATIVVCLRTRIKKTGLELRSALLELRAAGIVIPKRREVWLEADDGLDEASNFERWLTVSFEASHSLLQNLLWCALSRDLSSVRPNPGCLVYLFNLQSGLMVWPYDSRGMDVVGPNRERLRFLYHKHQSYLLEYDRARMDEMFAG